MGEFYPKVSWALTKDEGATGKMDKYELYLGLRDSYMLISQADNCTKVWLGYKQTLWWLRG